MDKKEAISQVVKGIEARWKSNVVARSQVGEITGGALSPKSLANMDSKGEGPDGRFLMGRQTVYPLPSFLTWLGGMCK